ncbi:MAG: phosphatase PAP2 family protein [Anaerovoracaceae bacterium]|jgi:undecaprenyl-diphosphatase
MKKTTGLWIILIAGILGFAWVTWGVVSGSAQPFDNALINAFVDARQPGLSTLMEGITYLGNWEAIVIICLLLLLKEDRAKKYGWPAAAAAVITTLVRIVIKDIVQRPRPDRSLFLIDQNGWSFPSGHAITSIAVYGLLFILFMLYMKKGARKTVICALCAVLAFAIGISRIYLAVHYPSDVLGGWLLGISTIAGMLLLIDFVKKKFASRKL